MFIVVLKWFFFTRNVDIVKLTDLDNSEYKFWITMYIVEKMFEFVVFTVIFYFFTVNYQTFTLSTMFSFFFLSFF